MSRGVARNSDGVDGEVAAFLERHAEALGGRTSCVARAPGRLDLMGGIADYSGSLVLQLPIAEATIAAAQHCDGDTVVVESHAVAGAPAPRRFEIALGRVRQLVASGYDTARSELTRDPEQAWVSYVLGPLLVLMRECDLALESGLRIWIESRVPEGKGVSSSAALEVATLLAIAGLGGVSIEGREVARLCQLAENRVVGAPCGIMDQMASALGRSGELLVLRCQPAELLGFCPIPDGLAVWGIDSGVRHAVSGASYTEVRVGAFMGYRILAELAGLVVESTAAPGLVRIADPRWNGYLANVCPDEFERDFAARIPEAMTGSEFLARYAGLTDSVVSVDPSVSYAVRQPTRHPIHENRRVERFAERIAGELGESAMREIGALMFDSHASYSACGLGCDATDAIVDLVRDQGATAGLYGAKITGGGSGGTVAVLGRADADPHIRAIAARHAAARGHEPYVFRASSMGAMAQGVMTV